MKLSRKYIYVLLAAIIIAGSCKKKEDEKLPPAINFKSGDSFTSENDTVMVGYRLSFGVQARGTSEKITNFSIKKILEDGTVITMFDTGLYAESLDLNKVFYQNVESKATWVFSVMDRNRMSSEIRRVVYKDPLSQFGGIIYYPSLKLGFQESTLFGHFIDLSQGRVHFQDTAGMIQEKIEMLIYFDTNDNPPTPVLSSPGEMDNFGTDMQEHYPFVASWTTRKYTKWDVSVDNAPIPVAAFDSAQNDSLLLVSYHDAWGKKKFKYATTGKVVPFMTSAGKKGLIKIISADNSANGAMEIAVKIQQ